MTNPSILVGLTLATYCVQYQHAVSFLRNKMFYPLDDHCRTFNMNDNQKNNILMSENIIQKRLTILEYLDAYICHHYQPKITLIMMTNICTEIFHNC